MANTQPVLEATIRIRLRPEVFPATSEALSEAYDMVSVMLSEEYTEVVQDWGYISKDAAGMIGFVKVEQAMPYEEGDMFNETQE